MILIKQIFRLCFPRMVGYICKTEIHLCFIFQDGDFFSLDAASSIQIPTEHNKILNVAQQSNGKRISIH